MRLFFSIVLVTTIAVSAGAQVQLANPGLPRSETIVYNEKFDNVADLVKQATVLKTENGKSYYESLSRSDRSDLLLKIDPKSFDGFFSDVTEHMKEATVRRTSEIVSDSTTAKNDELVVGDLNSLPFVLRGFPFSTVNFARLVFVGSPNASVGFSLELRVKGKETVKLGEKNYECWKMELAVSGILGAIVPKSYFWYSVDAPHYLVRSEGAQGGPGSATRILELQSYQSSN